MHHWREVQFERHLTSPIARWALKIWAFVAARPSLYHPASRLGMGLLAWLGRGKGRLSSLPLAGGWTRHRELPAPQGQTFQAQWVRRGGSVS